MIYERRLNFCTWLIEMDAQNPTFIERILLLRKLIFLVPNGVVNLRNMHYWALNNLHVIRMVHN
jgi:hypothetical protein